MNIILFDLPEIRQSLLPFTYTRPVAGIRIGIFTIAEKWERYFGREVSFLTEDYLAIKYPFVSGEENLFINGALCPDKILTESISKLSTGKLLMKGNIPLAIKSVAADKKNIVTTISLTQTERIEYEGEPLIIKKSFDIFRNNGAQIRSDFELLKPHSSNDGIDDPFTRVYNPDNIIIEPGVKIRAAVLNAENGPIYLGKNAEIHEGALIRGPFALCESSVVNMGAKIRGDVTIGPYSKVGGEISNSIIFGYSNKAHDGFLGNSVVGEWCNLGADTNTSNLKNNYSDIKIWDYPTGDYKDTGLIFCGLMMGDHSKCGINTMFNTGTVVGVNANIFGGNFPPKFIPSFTWGGASNSPKFDLKKALEVASKAMERRNIELSTVDIQILIWVYQHGI